MLEPSPSHHLLASLQERGAIIGKNVFVGSHVFIEVENAMFLTLEDNVVLSPHVSIILHDSCLNNISGFEVVYGQVILERNVYVGAHTLILPGTIIGKNTIVGAGSLVKGTLQSNSVYMGRPARRTCSVTELETTWHHRKKQPHPYLTYLATAPFRTRSAADQLELEAKKRAASGRQFPPPILPWFHRIRQLLKH